MYVEKEEVIGVLHVPVAERQGFPAPRFVHEHLTALNLGFVAIRDVPEDLPRQAVAPQSAEVGPEHRADRAIVRLVEQVRRIDDRHIVGVEEQHFLEGRMGDGVRPQLPKAGSTSLAAKRCGR